MLIGLAGPKRSGKTLAAEYLAEVYGFHHDSFAAPLRRFACDVLDLTLHELETLKESPVDWLDDSRDDRPQVTPRRFLQLVGTEFGRNLIHPHLWVRACLRRVEGQANVVISDCRFGNEARAIRERGGIVVRLNGRGELADKHISEVPLHASLVDFEVDNSGDVRWLHEQLNTLIDRYVQPTAATMRKATQAGEIGN